MKKKRARTKSESLGIRLKKAVKSVLKKKKTSPRKVTLTKKSSADAAKPGRKLIKTGERKTLTSVSRSRLYVTVKGKAKIGEQQAQAPDDLPFSYGKTELVLLVRDPEWAYAYWDFSAETWSWIQSVLKKNPGAPVRLRLHNHTQGGFFDVDVHLEAKNWYICLGIDNTEFEAELGILDRSGKFLTICRSNRVKTPRIKPSNEIDPYWVPDHFDEFYRLSGGGGSGASSSFIPVVKKPTS